MLLKKRVSSIWIASSLIESLLRLVHLKPLGLILSLLELPLIRLVIIGLRLLVRLLNVAALIELLLLIIDPLLLPVPGVEDRLDLLDDELGDVDLGRGTYDEVLECAVVSLEIDNEVDQPLIACEGKLKVLAVGRAADKLVSQLPRL